MKDIRLFLRENILYMFDRGATRSKLPTSMLSISKSLNIYKVKVVTENIDNEGTAMLEDIIVKVLESSQNQPISATALELPIILSSQLEANETQINTAISALSIESNVDRIMKEVLALDHKERTDLILAILDLL